MTPAPRNPDDRSRTSRPTAPGARLPSHQHGIIHALITLSGEADITRNAYTISYYHR
ncbi:hypothetical protein HNP84_008584 [Thermocatellispora tengchongensis]|uniref:Uncharacterized protein n=1 Tax=Thermocatellispora tengchongensis TaxID=1073253 RepID=A0A840PIX5_9ACTN|nr:hypothetical protein [Thermocatellispora tengchongensis]